MKVDYIPTALNHNIVSFGCRGTNLSLVVRAATHISSTARVIVPERLGLSVSFRVKFQFLPLAHLGVADSGYSLKQCENECIF